MVLKKDLYFNHSFFNHLHTKSLLDLSGMSNFVPFPAGLQIETGGKVKVKVYVFSRGYYPKRLTISYTFNLKDSKG